MKVSVLIPCFNARQWVAQAIQSALDQTWPDKEVIVVDDGSTDGSLDVIRSFGDAIRVESGPNRGGNVARNRLLELAQGEWLQYLDADDYLFADKIERQVTSTNPREADLIVSSVTMEHWSAAHPPTYVIHEVDPAVDPWVLLIRWIMPQTGAALWRRSAITDVGGWKINQPCCQEHELYLRMLQAERKLVFSDAVGAVYRIWSENTVCRRDPLLTFTKRLEVVDACEDWLESHGMLTPDRRQAIGNTRLECARSLYSLDVKAALRVAEKSRQQAPGLRLGNEHCFPLSYRLAYRIAGFKGAERLAAFTRHFRSICSRETG